MKKKSLFIIILIIVVVIGLRFLFSNEKKESVSAEDVIYNELIEYAK